MDLFLRRSNKPNIFLFSKKRRMARRIRLGAAMLFIGLAVVSSGFYLTGRVNSLVRVKPANSRELLVYSEKAGQFGLQEELTKESLAKLIGSRNLDQDDGTVFSVKNKAGRSLFVRTTLDPALQKWAVKTVNKTQADEAAVVALDPENGNVLAMASYSVEKRPDNLTLCSDFPAASLFKIITAAAAVESKHMSSQSTIAYDGSKHTLYRKNLAKDVNKGQNQATLKKSFAESINTVFGKIGAFALGPSALQEYAQRFYFNQPIGFEMPVETSRFVTPDADYYHLAEIASGFNNTTRVSPLHGAMLAAAVANGGLVIEPTLVREVFDESNNIYYHQEPVTLGRPISSRTADELKRMMIATITDGTGRKHFRDIRTNRVLSSLEIGGKTGSINDDRGRRVDWFVCFAGRPRTDEKMALAVLVVHHNDKIGVRAARIGRECIIRYF